MLGYAASINWCPQNDHTKLQSWGKKLAFIILNRTYHWEYWQNMICFWNLIDWWLYNYMHTLEISYFNSFLFLRSFRHFHKWNWVRKINSKPLLIKLCGFHGTCKFYRLNCYVLDRLQSACVSFNSIPHYNSMQVKNLRSYVDIPVDCRLIVIIEVLRCV